VNIGLVKAVTFKDLVIQCNKRIQNGLTLSYPKRLKKFYYTEMHKNNLYEELIAQETHLTKTHTTLRR
jgi:hypothetical protein